MSTFFGGETLINVAVINGSSNVSQTVYTVPAGRYAEVNLQSFSCTSGGTILVGSMTVASVGSPGPVVATINTNYILYAGQSISFTVAIGAGANFNWYLIAKEFSIP